MASIDRRITLSGLIATALPRRGLARLMTGPPDTGPLDNRENLCLDLRRRVAETFRWH